jgi:hypothetical protein
LAEISSRIAACGQPPVSTAATRSSGRTYHRRTERKCGWCGRAHGSALRPKRTRDAFALASGGGALGAHIVAQQELGVLAREDIVRDARDVVLVAEPDAELAYQRSLPAAHGATNPDSEAAVVERPRQGTLAVAKLPCRHHRRNRDRVRGTAGPARQKQVTRGSQRGTGEHRRCRSRGRGIRAGSVGSSPRARCGCRGRWPWPSVRPQPGGSKARASWTAVPRDYRAQQDERSGGSSGGRAGAAVAASQCQPIRMRMIMRAPCL